MRYRWTWPVVVPILLSIGGWASPALAHEERETGALTVVVGWSEEPAFTGLKNAVAFFANRTGSGEAVTDGDLQAVVIFGPQDSDERSEPIRLVASHDSPGEYLGTIIPTRPGTYTFHITGTVGGMAIDEFFTSGEGTFDDVVNPTEVEFPAQDPLIGEVAQRVDQVASRLDQVASRVDQAASTVGEASSSAASAADRAGTATTLAVVGVALGVVGVGLGGWAAMRSGRRAR